jgi:hypothetical protein
VSAPVVNRDRLIELQRAHRYVADSNLGEPGCVCGLGFPGGFDYIEHAEHVADVLIKAELFRDEATVKAELAEKVAEIAEEAADDLDLPVMAEWLDQRDWFKGQLHTLAAKAREAGESL